MFFSKQTVRNRDLGHLEQSVMQTLWSRGTGSVRDVAGRLDQTLAYNTVMTTLDRLFKKGLLHREKKDRAFLYTPRFTFAEWQKKQAEEAVAGFLTEPQARGELIVSYLLDTIGQHDTAFLEELEERIRQRRRELETGSEG